MVVRSLALAAIASFVLAASASAEGWGGYYLGFNAGQGSAETDTTRTIGGAGYFLPSSIPAVQDASAMMLEEKTFAGGGQIGMNWPVGKWLLFGLEVDAQGFGNDASGAKTVTYPCCVSNFTVSNTLEQSWFATARLRAGFAFDWFLIYGTGGYAGADMKFTQTFSDTGGPIPLQTIENSEFRSGYSAGGGIEVMVESGFSLKVEYLHLNLGHIENAGTIAVGTRTSDGTADVTDKVWRVGLNWQID